METGEFCGGKQNSSYRNTRTGDMQLSACSLFVCRGCSHLDSVWVKSHRRRREHEHSPSPTLLDKSMANIFFSVSAGTPLKKNNIAFGTLVYFELHLIKPRSCPGLSLITVKQYLRWTHQKKAHSPLAYSKEGFSLWVLWKWKLQLQPPSFFFASKLIMISTFGILIHCGGK